MQPTPDVTSQVWTVLHRHRDDAADRTPKHLVLAGTAPCTKAEALVAARDRLPSRDGLEVLFLAEGADCEAALAEWQQKASRTWLVLGRAAGDKGDDQPRRVVTNYPVPVASEVAVADALRRSAFERVLWASPTADFQKVIDDWQDATAWEWIALFREEGTSAIQALPMNFYDREDARAASDRVKALHGEDAEILWLARETRDIVKALDGLYAARPELRPEAQDAPSL